MRTLSGNTKKRTLLRDGLDKVAKNKRYIFWFWVLNLTLAEFGASAFRRSAHAILDHSLYSGGLLHGFDRSVWSEFLAQPGFGQLSAMVTPAAYFSFLFFLSTALFLPGVFQGYASADRLPREDFFRACGRNLWRFSLVTIVGGIVMGVVAGLLLSLNDMHVQHAAENTNELLPFEMQILDLAVIFLIMTALRIVFDLAEVDIVLSNHGAGSKAIWNGLRHTFRSLANLLGSYVVTTIVAAAMVVIGLLCWLYFVPSESVGGAFVVSQLTLLLLLIPRFWQRGVAVSYWQQKMMAPVAEVNVIAAESIPAFPVLAAEGPNPPPIQGS